MYTLSSDKVQEKFYFAFDKREWTLTLRAYSHPAKGRVNVKELIKKKFKNSFSLWTLLNVNGPIKSKIEIGHRTSKKRSKNKASKEKFAIAFAFGQCEWSLALSLSPRWYWGVGLQLRFVKDDLIFRSILCPIY